MDCFWIGLGNGNWWHYTQNFLFDKLKRLSLVSYIVMGWLSLIVFKSLLNAAPAELVVWLLIGGAFYTGGLIFIVGRNSPSIMPFGTCLY
jgi:channel protein (hemolysin III family)